MSDHQNASQAPPGKEKPLDAANVKRAETLSNGTEDDGESIEPSHGFGKSARVMDPAWAAAHLAQKAKQSAAAVKASETRNANSAKKADSGKPNSEYTGGDFDIYAAAANDFAEAVSAAKASKPPRLTYSGERIAAMRKAFGLLARVSIFTLWWWAWKDGKEGELGMWTKPPEHPFGTPGITLDEALARFNADPHYAGIGVKCGPVPGESTFVYGIDYDGYDKAERFAPKEWLDTPMYRERTPSGGINFHGLAMFIGPPLAAAKQTDREIYTESRYLTVTGDVLEGSLETIGVADPRPLYKAIGVSDPQPYGAKKMNVECHNAPISEEELTDVERRILAAVRARVKDDPDKRSECDFAFCCEAIRHGATDEQASRLLCAARWRVKLERLDYVSNTIAKARESVGNPPPASEAPASREGVENSPPLDEHETFWQETKRIGKGEELNDKTTTRIYSLEEMLDEYIYVSDGQVASKADPRWRRMWPDFRRFTAASNEPGPRNGTTYIADLWMEHPERETVDAITFRPGAGRKTRSPKDELALNTWREPPCMTPPENWEEIAAPFFEHAAFLVSKPEELAVLLNWLAHIHQKPGELPQYGILMTTPTHGIGRNWLSAVIARTAPGLAALDVDLPLFLEGDFNEIVSQKLLAVVNEIRAGTMISHKQFERFKQMITNSQREINVKYGRKHIEFNCCRWLLYSNHFDALPLEREDRRLMVIENPREPKSADYYDRLYKLAQDRDFIASVREALLRRDITGYNACGIAPRTEARAKVIEAGLSDADEEMQFVIDTHPSDCITANDLCDKLFGPNSLPSERMRVRWIAPKAGAIKHKERPRVFRKQSRIWVLRNHDLWLTATALEIAAEAERGMPSNVF